MDVTDKQFNIKWYFIIVLVKCKHEKTYLGFFLVNNILISLT